MPGRLLAFVFLSALSGVSVAQLVDAGALRGALAPGGTLRAAFLGANPVQGTIDPRTGEVRGPAADVARELARTMSVPLSLLPQAGVAAVMEAVRSGAADIGFLAFDATRAEQVAFTQAYILGHNSYLVRADSPIREIADADREGVRIGAREGIAVDLFLSRTLERAELVHLPRTATDADAARMLIAGELDAYAANKQRLAAQVANEPRVRMLDGSVLPVEQSMVVAQYNEAGLAQLNHFIDNLRASGFLQEVVERYVLAGVEVAPPSAR